ncbi:hypothetical protein F441_08267 [Phytophthora nicotianae CJ01A1]|uniref:Uncharacterized protein n=1 Tax=Phytophthora nicotianae CJ01A1 TaxID=1317063 RepID=W2X5U3_PHYNI|nr:hypothetical protein F441_08267 [Phytophthora nicotianae CJ01A1]
MTKFCPFLNPSRSRSLKKQPSRSNRNYIFLKACAYRTLL